jgi:hypothetical protein
MTRKGRQRWAFWEWKDIHPKGEPNNVHLRRLRIIQTPWLGIYLHWIFRPDQDGDPHDHPWNFWSFVLSGGYAELLGTSSNSLWWPFGRDRFSIHRMNINHSHRIDQVLPGTMTLVVVGRVRQEWGFWVPSQHPSSPIRTKVPWRDYLGGGNG